MAGRPYSWSKQLLKLGRNLGSLGPAGSKMVRPDKPVHAASKLFCLRLSPEKSAFASAQEKPPPSLSGSSVEIDENWP